MRERQDKWVALVRGLNVGKANRVAMAELRRVASDVGWRGVQSYIASGNLVFEADVPQGRELQDALADRFGIDVPVLVLPAELVIKAQRDCPWDVAGNLVHVFFCWAIPAVDFDLFDELKAADEVLVCDGALAWFYAPSGVARSKVMSRMEAVLGGCATARNLNSVRKLADMCR